jgi:hypothetical protein
VHTVPPQQTGRWRSTVEGRSVETDPNRTVIREAMNTSPNQLLDP